jgi:hypothetical protein
VVSGTLFIQLAWILALPPFRGIDEFDHAYRAASVAHGYWINEDHPQTSKAWGALIPVPRALVEAASEVCSTYEYVGRANCSSVVDLDDGMGLAASGAANYNPLFYGLVGWPALFTNGGESLYGMRVVASLLCAALLGLATWSMGVWARTRWPFVALVICLTPMTTFSFILPAPNGIEMASALSAWSAVLGLTRVRRKVELRALIWILTVSAVPLAVTRLLGPVWLLLILTVGALLLGRCDTLNLWRSARVHVSILIATCLVASATAATWSLLSNPNPISLSPDPTGSASANDLDPLDLLEHSILWVLQAIAAFPTRNEFAPIFVYVAELLLFATFLVHAYWRATVRLRVVGAMAAIGAFLGPTMLTAVLYESIDFSWQGRYALPLTFGVALLAGLALDVAGKAQRWLVPLASMGSVVVAACHATAIARVLRVEQRTSPLSGDPRWLEPSGALVVILVLCGVTLWLLAVIWPSISVRDAVLQCDRPTSAETQTMSPSPEK